MDFYINPTVMRTLCKSPFSPGDPEQAIVNHDLPNETVTQIPVEARQTELRNPVSLRNWVFRSLHAVQQSLPVEYFHSQANTNNGCHDIANNTKQYGVCRHNAPQGQNADHGRCAVNGQQKG